MILADNKKPSLLIAFLIVLCAFASADAQAYGGRAIGVNASVTTNGSTTNSVFADTGELPAVGGIRSASASSSTVAGVMSTGELTASTTGALRSSQSTAVAENVNIVVGNYQITASAIIANSGCICCPGDDIGACSGRTAVGNLVVTNTSTGAQTGITVTGEPNQVVELAGVGTLTINQQIDGGNSITVNGLRVNATAGGTTYDLIVASSRSSIQCLTLAPSAGEVTMSGRVLTKRGTGLAKATVTVTDGNGNTRTATTDSQGRYSISLLDAGTTYFVSATHKSHTFEAVTVTPEADVVVDLVAK